MICPVCRGETLVTLEFRGSELEFCPTCRGVWLGFDQRTAFGSSLDAVGSAPPDPTSGERPRSCPQCGKRMEKLRSEVTTAIRLDRCAKHGIWFDNGELRAILESTGHDARSWVEFLRQVLSLRPEGEEVVP
ncbi:MAG: hypothetical protein A2284_11255 [Deltaproteobacteria bacterium RIFOXYA12_FULL_61_11]|nr:MAG: hypothetical protein A2284_11255 [Deltaproteobacteria bacterium RIFOXYA12_FULL_61_11]